ncbi:hypothetical protein SARC_04101 [Sphaeroforma arctica JP610]|uniref:Uncharacterized protein n=1 Tax=Sphaeroforma arctica JP610 TaxID=667725 RepID=A0A0L0G476_9EUKA|nr:hypothetical protein SARC_04101 [Sphaeroforma arctica JP610]KNC83669.1 hypothetical protein SARC_04101 [Sphaeroforma arctica JP610]|eukprot:XP_014157571.1 hypothetical protein SARC_04101 [Sphaeroforma arctica JP610]
MQCLLVTLYYYVCLIYVGRVDQLHSSLLTRFEPPLRCVEAGGEYIINGDINLDNDTNIRIVRPISGNIHELYAVTDTAFLDVLGPPYEEGVRDCHYYRDLGRREVVKAAAEHTTDTQKCRTTQIFSLWSPAHVAGNTSSISADEITSGGDEITRGDDAIVSGEDRPEDGESGQRYRYLANVDDGDFVCRSTPYIGYRPKVDNC